MMKKQSQKQLQIRIKRFLKIYPDPTRNALKHEIYAYLQNKKQKNINNELKKLKWTKISQ